MKSKKGAWLWLPQLLAAAILLQTLFFKFSAAPESVYIFSKLGAEPWGRWASGGVELIAALLLLWPSKAWLGAGLALMTMTGALASHLTVLGIVVQGDGGFLFALACTVTLCCGLVLAFRWPQHLVARLINKEIPHVV